MKRISFKEWLYKPDEDGCTGEMLVTFSCIIPILTLLLVSIGTDTIAFSVLPITLVVQFLYVLVYYLFDSRIR